MSYFGTPRHSKAVQKRQERKRATEAGVLGIQPEETDSPRRKAVLAGALVLAVLAAGSGIAYALSPDPKVNVFDGLGMPFIDGKQIDCTYVLENYQPGDFTDRMIAGGAPAIYSGSDAQEGVKFYRDHMDGAVAGACDAYYREHKNTPKHEQFVVHTSTDPVVGEQGSYRLVVDLQPTGRIAG